MKDVGKIVTVVINSDGINNYYPAIITASVALIAAVLAQVLSNSLTSDRERRKDFMEKYQNAYVDLINYLYIFMQIQTNPKSAHDLHAYVIPEDLVEMSFNIVKNNIKYLSPEALQIYKEYLGSEYYSDGIGPRKDFHKVRILYFVLDDVLRSSKYKKIFSKKDRKSLRLLKYNYGVYAIAKFILEEEAKEYMTLMEFYGGKINSNVNLNKPLLQFNIHQYNEILLKHIDKIEDIYFAREKCRRVQLKVHKLASPQSLFNFDAKVRL